MAEALGVSRAAVNKAVDVLKVAGYRIEAVPNRGYRLASDTDILSRVAIERYLGEDAGRFHLQVFDSVESTNDIARTWARNDSPEFTTVIAGNQTAGRGRRGRLFFSPADTGLYMSILVRPHLDARDSSAITAIAAVAVAEAIEEVSAQDARIKWVNDVYVDGRKVCGILTEGSVSVEDGRLEYVIVGIGINAYEPEGGFPPDIAAVAGAVFSRTSAAPAVPAEGGASAAPGEGEAPAAPTPGISERPQDARNQLAASVLERFASYYEHIGDGTYVEPYRERSFLPGLAVEVSKGSSTRRAQALSVDEQLRLHVRYDDGTEEALDSGEVSVHTR